LIVALNCAPVSNGLIASFNFDYSMRGELTLAPLNVLFCDGAHIFLRPLGAPGFVQRAVPGILFLIDGNFALPLGVELKLVF